MKSTRIIACAIAALMIPVLLCGCGETAKDSAVKVSSVDELLAAIAPGATIELAEGTYDLSTASDYGSAEGGEFYKWSDVFDGFELVIKNVTGLTIKASSEYPSSTVISAVPRYANVLSFRSCDDISFSGFTAGHTVEPGACSGGVFYFQNCHGVKFDQCRMYGCGTLGIECNQCSDITVTGGEIYECSDGAASFYESDSISFSNCSVHDIASTPIRFMECETITWNGAETKQGFYNVSSDGTLELVADWSE